MPVAGGVDDLLVRTVTGRAVWPRTFHSRIWRTATTGAGLPEVRFQQLRHFYASALIRAGESVKTVQVALGHASAVEDPADLRRAVAGPRPAHARRDRWSRTGSTDDRCGNRCTHHRLRQHRKTAGDVQNRSFCPEERCDRSCR